MDYFQAVVTEYLRAHRGTFVNTECCIQLNPGDNPDTSGPHWYCDAVAVNFELKKISLCEVTYSKSLSALMKRLSSWAENWELLKIAIVRDSFVPADWAVQPAVFVAEELLNLLKRKLGVVLTNTATTMPYPDLIALESVLPWKYRSWNRKNGCPVSP